MSQTQTFDPYYTWLGIPPEEQPPNHYRLLGIKLFETNADVIANAADRQVRHVRTYQSGKNAEQSQEVLNKLSSARNCLLNPKQKADYDEQLQKETKSAAPAPAAARPAARSSPKLVVAAALEDPAPFPTVQPQAAPMHTGPAGHSMHPAGHPGQHAANPLQPVTQQGIPPWMIFAGLGGVALVGLIIAGVVVSFLLTPPTVVTPGPKPFPGPGPNPPFVRPGPGPGPMPGPGPSPFVPVAGGRNPKMIPDGRDGNPNDPGVTTGLMGDIRFGANLILVRYRLGEQIDGSVFDKIRASGNWPPNMPFRLRLTGMVEIPEGMQAEARVDVTGTDPKPTDVKLSGTTWIRRGPGSGGTQTHTGDLNPGMALVEWTIEDVTSGKWRLNLVSKADQRPLPVATPQGQLSVMRGSLTGAATEILFAQRPLVVTSSAGGGLAANDFGSGPGPAVIPGVSPSGPVQGALPFNVVDGPDDSLTATTGLIGRLQINFQDAGILVRYRMGGQLTQTKLNEVCSALNIPTGQVRLTLLGQVAVAQRFTSETDLQVGAQGYGRVFCDEPSRGRTTLGQVGRGYPQSKTQATDMNPGTGRLRWELEGNNDIGTASFTFKDKASGTPLKVYYTKSDLDEARRQPTVAEMVVLADKVLFRQNETLVAALPKDPNVPVGDDALVLGDEEDAATTSGLIGRLLIDGQDVGVVFRYRLGRTFTSGWFDDIRRQLNLPAGQPELVLTGTITVPARTRFGSGGTSVASKMTGGSRNAGTSTLYVDDSSWFNLGGTSPWTQNTHHAYLQPGRHAIKWTLRGAPIGECSLTINPTDTSQKVEVGYSTNELKAARKLPLKHEFVMAEKHTVSLRYAGGKLAGSQKISTDPSMGGAVVIAPPPMVDPSAPAAKREPIPSETKLKEAETLVRDVLGKEIDAAKNPIEKAAVAKKLLQNSRETSDDLAARYVLLTKCKDLAAAGGDTATMCMAIDELDGVFDVDGLKLKSSGFYQASNAALPPPEFGPMTREVLDLVDATVAEDRFDLAVKLADVAGECARRSKDKDLTKQAGDKKRDVTAFKKQYDTIDSAHTKLKESPTDPTANLTLGKYKALVKGDWPAALPHLEKGSDGQIAAAAKLDLAAPTDKDARIKIGDGWWDLGDKAPEEDQLGYKLRAHYWYKLALPELDGIAKLRVEKRVGEVDDEASKMAARSKGPGAGGAVNRPQPGLVLRVYDRDPTRNLPTHMLAVISESDELERWVERAARDETTKLGINISNYYLLTGYIYLTANTTVSIDVTYSAVLIDNKPLTDAQFTAKQFQIPMTRGLHPITIVCNDSSSARFTVVDQKSGSNVLYYDTKQLQTELGRTVNGPRGQPLKGMMLQRPKNPGF